MIPAALRVATRQRNRDLVAISVPLPPDAILSGPACTPYTTLGDTDLQQGGGGRGARRGRAAALDHPHSRRNVVTTVNGLSARQRRQTPQLAPTLIVPSAGRRCAGLHERGHARRRRARKAVVGLSVVGVVVMCVVDPVSVLAAGGTGFFNIVGGGGAIITFLAMTAVGMPALTVHATGQAVTPVSFVSMVGLVRRYWPGLRLLVTGSAGTVVGVVVLKLSPVNTVQDVAPSFLAVAGLLVLVQGPVQRRIQRVGRELGPKTTLVLMLAVGIYAGMIGVGTGTLALAVLGLTPHHAQVELQQLVLTRNVLLLGMACVVSVSMIFTGLVSWPLAAVLALPAAVGGWLGVKVIHKLPVPVLRTSIAATAGVGAVWMWMR
jgi:hypothetical protein